MNSVPALEAMLEEARQATGLVDFGPEEFRPALAITLKTLGEEANLTDDGLKSELAEIRTLLVNRLRFEEMLRRHPDIAEEKIERPVIIIGPQRSGTSKLFRVIASDPQWNCLLTWQAIDPVPPGMERPAPESEDERIAKGDKWVETMASQQIAHSFETRSPEMEALLMKDSFLLNSGKRVTPSHLEFTVTADYRPVYHRLRRQLQLIQWQNRSAGKRWILKTPPHLMGIQALADEFPDATFVMTHRHPAISVASMCRLTELAQAAAARSVDHAKIGRFWFRILSVELQNYIDFEDRGNADRVVHVTYDQVENDSLAAVRAIYAKAGAEVSANTIASIEAWEAANPRHKHGSFKYRLEDYGLNQDMLAKAFAPWLARYGHMLLA